MDFSRLDEFLKTIQENFHIPGYECIVSKKHDVLFDKCYGYCDIENKIPTSPDNYYYGYSVSKITLSVCVMQLVEKGKISLDDKLSDYIPEFGEMRLENGDTAKKPILIRHLLSMTSGLPYGYYEELKKWSENTDKSTLSVVKCMSKLPLSFEPGDDYQYSWAHDVLGGVIEVVTGLKYSEYAKKYVFEPCGMNEITFRMTDDVKARLAKKYGYSEEKGLFESPDNIFCLFPEFDSGGAGVITTPRDYAKLARALASNGISDTGNHILEPTSIDLMRTNNLNTPEKIKKFQQNQHVDYLYCLGVRSFINTSRRETKVPIGEFGWDGAVGALVSMEPTTGISVTYFQHIGSRPFKVNCFPRILDLAYEIAQN